MALKKQFIAGAICPACGAQDTIAQVIDSERKQFECVSCGYRETMSEQATEQTNHSAVHVAKKRPLESMIPVINVDDEHSSN